MEFEQYCVFGYSETYEAARQVFGRPLSVTDELHFLFFLFWPPHVCITCAKIRNIINNSAGIARFRSNFVQTFITWRLMYQELSRSAGRRSKSQRNIMYHHENAIIHARISCRRSNLVKSIPEPSATRNTCSRSLGHVSAPDSSISFKFGT